LKTRAATFKAQITEVIEKFSCDGKEKLTTHLLFGRSELRELADQLKTTDSMKQIWSIEKELKALEERIAEELKFVIGGKCMTNKN
jgi:predicted aldo/keto reductase-like oxidoreductase